MAVKKLLAAAAVCAFLGNPAWAGPEEGLFNAAKTMIANAQSQPDDARLSAYRSARDLLDLVVSSYRSSEIGQAITTGGVVQGVDVDALNRTLQSGSIDPDGPVLIDLGTTIVTAPAAAASPAPAEAPPAQAAQEPSPKSDAIVFVPLVTPEAVDQPSEAAPQVAATPQSEPAGAPTATGAEQFAATAAPAPPSLPAFEIEPTPLDPGTEATEASLDLGKPEIRDIQARLLVLGHDPNGIDGVVGRGTRGALGVWQTENSVQATGYLSASQLARLREQSEEALTAWLQTPENATLYDPPTIALTPGNVSGRWRFTSTCGANSRLGRVRITGILSIRHAGGNQYTGSARQSQGFNGRFAGRLQGRQMVGEINWGLLVGRTSFSGTVADEELVITGRDSNRCGFYARK